MAASQQEPTIKSERIFEGRILNLRVDTVQMPRGVVAVREIAEHSHSICAVPVDSQGNVLMVRQYRKPTESELLEVVAGGIEDGENPEEAALRELQEEIGHTAGRLQLLCGFWLAPGWCTEYMYSYLATDLSRASLEADEDENISVDPVPLRQVPELIRSGEIQDAKSIASLLLAIQAWTGG